jgi:hypothetical protein
MRKLTEQDITAIIGTSANGYIIERAKIKFGKFSDSDHYGYVLGRNEKGMYVTWQFHLINEEPSFYWGHYTEDGNTALRDFNTRG